MRLWGGCGKSLFQSLFSIMRLGGVIFLDDMSMWLFLCLDRVLHGLVPSLSCIYSS